MAGDLYCRTGAAKDVLVNINVTKNQRIRRNSHKYFPRRSFFDEQSGT